MVKDGDVLVIGDIHVRVLFTPCHTKGHVLYYLASSSSSSKGTSPPMLFSGDTLFIGGCGRFFEGTGAEMNYALNDVVAKLDKNTLVC